ncbi:histidine phosphotransferase family protein [Nereida sp. MMG025]|uniref:histidine phosphotransferase family protein n=1 Tax=Nereida sp. MMG025 TaxID=2909981 RepID=UPI001F41B995|nr:histidine phosphotransferase family protein [Nereida sp. MMG025]MCF6443406.1 histidine phosphotransferase family protein [Nereida sp. MMG025]
MTKTDLDISTLVGSRICHDLISPLGAIANGVELLSLSGLPQTPEMALIADSVENANARIKMFRIAFGAASADQQVNASDMQAIMVGLTRGGRLRYDWQAQGSALRIHARFALLLVQALETAMAYGGQITVSETAGTWVIKGTADRLVHDPALWRYVDDTQNADQPLQASQVHFELIAQLQHDHGFRVTADVSDTEIAITF